MIVQALRSIQDRYGYLPEHELEFVAWQANVPLYRVQEVASFYPHFRKTKPPTVQISLCVDMSCHQRGAGKLLDEARAAYGKDESKVGFEPASCLGRCDMAIAGCVHNHGGHHGSNGHAGHGETYFSLPAGKEHETLRSIAAGNAPPRDPAVNHNKPWILDVYDPKGVEEAQKARLAECKKFDVERAKKAVKAAGGDSEDKAAVEKAIAEEPLHFARKRAEYTLRRRKIAKEGNPGYDAELAKVVDEERMKWATARAKYMIGRDGGNPNDAKAVDDLAKKVVAEQRLFTPPGFKAPTRHYAAARWFFEQAAKNPIRRDTKNPEGVLKDVLDAIKWAGLVGLGGAGGRTSKKWEDCFKEAGDEKYVVCNGDESEPGTFKDREILTHSPYLVVEGVMMAVLVLGAKRGYIYIRHEYPEQIAATERAVEEAKEILGPDFDKCPVEVFVSPGGYICGEQSALIEAMMDHRSQPRNTPPALTSVGLHDKPTVVNNIETMAWVPAMMLRWIADTTFNENPPLIIDGTLAVFDPARESAPRPAPKPGEAPKPPAPRREERDALADLTLESSVEEIIERAGGLSRQADSEARLELTWPKTERYTWSMRRLFSISGDLVKPGVFEMSINDTLGDLIKMAGGSPPGREVKAIAGSGPSGGFIPAELPAAPLRDMIVRKLPGFESRDPEVGRRLKKFMADCLGEGVQNVEVLKMPLDLFLFRALGLALGAGVIVYGRKAGDKADDSMIADALNCSEFYARETCGKCVPCRLGTQELVQLGAAIKADPGKLASLKADVDNLSEVMNDTSICGLGKSAYQPLSTAVNYRF